MSRAKCLLTGSAEGAPRTLKRNPLESLLFAVPLGVGLTPEFLPMIAAVTLTSGAIRMAREQLWSRCDEFSGFPTRRRV